MLQGCLEDDLTGGNGGDGEGEVECFWGRLDGGEANVELDGLSERDKTSKELMIAVQVGLLKCKGRSIVATTPRMVIRMRKGWR